MITGIGCDIVDHAETKQLGWLSDIETLKRVFSTLELELYKDNQTITFLAGRFAAKEAVLKCFGTGMRDGIALSDIQVLRGQAGEPRIELINEAKQLSTLSGIDAWHISITHSNSYSLAFAVAESFKT